MSRLLPLALLLLLSSALLGSSCDAPRAMDLEELRRDVAPSFQYDLYCDSAGKLVGDNSAVLLVYRSEHLERVYSDAQAGNPRAQALFAQLEQTLHGSGGLLAERATGLVCHSAPACTVQWHFLDELMPSRGPGGMRLRQVLADSFSRQARLQGVRNAVLAAAVSVLLATTVVKGAAVGAAEKEAATGAAGVSVTEAGGLARQALLEQRSGRPAAEATAAVEEVAALEARLAQALEAAPRHPARLDTLARLRPSVERPPTGVAADTPRWTHYVEYWERRYEQLASPAARTDVRPPLTWDSYSALLGRFQRALEFQRSAAQVLHREARVEQGQRVWLRGMERPLTAENVGLAREGSSTVVYVDQLTVDLASLGPGVRPSVHVFSNKQHNFANRHPKEALKQVELDAIEVHTKYGGTIEVRRPGHPLFGRKVVVSKVHLVYDGTRLTADFKTILSAEASVQRATLHFHVP